MFVAKASEIQSVEVRMPGVINAFKKSLIGPREGWEGWVMRLFTLRDKGCTPRHAHPWPHINYVTGGKGMLYLDGKEHHLETGSVAYVPAGVEHQFLGLGGEDFSFLCIVPEDGDK